MFKPTSSLQKMLRRLPLSPKQAGKEYYKGNRVGSMGEINRFGKFTPDWEKIRTFVYPIYGTKNSDLTPFVAKSVQKIRPNETTDKPEVYPKKFTGEDYLKAWKLAGGYDAVAEGVYEEVAGSRGNLPEPFEEKPVERKA